MKSLSSYKRNCELLQEQNKELQGEKQKVVYQLQSLFVLYNKQKGMIEKLENVKTTAETDKKSYKERLEDLEREKKRARAEQSRESEKAIARYKLMAEEMEQKVQVLEKRITAAEEASHAATLAEKDLREELKRREKNLLEAEYTLEITRSKLEGEIELIAKQKDQLKQANKVLENKLELAQRENERQAEDTQRLHRELTKLTYANDELSDEVQRWRRRCNASQKLEREERKVNDSYDTANTQRLAAIEKKLEKILRYQDISEQKVQEESVEESQNDEGENLEGVLKDLTAQILDKEELQNENVVKRFKLDQIQLDDKENEYKNLLKAMGALYFANRYSKMIQPLFVAWKEKLQEKINDVKEMEELQDEEELKDSKADRKSPLDHKKDSEAEDELDNRYPADEDFLGKNAKREVIKSLKADEDWERELESNEKYEDEIMPNFGDVRTAKKARSDQDVRDYMDYADIDDELIDEDIDQY
eukprot:TRINITY_DN11093_c0_g3_i2.p1 TRINITY_DN11093_c0_g3~~TRINITY_DN11093_c0_g3_i2.p1  ORF type:complete len:478 (-),score=184.28 TRINITY_DN11093_c0_g3_i2:150-1583(-)